MLSSFYPATTVILASLLLHEKISRPQWLGVLCCLAAVALIVG
jgi:drug/metabolite transporter (DMT)-like permease